MKIFSLAFLLLLQHPFASPVTDSYPTLNKNKLGPVNIVYKSMDGGQTWQDISEGLPENWQGGNFFANDNGLYVTVGNWICHNKPNAYAPFWEKKIFPAKPGSITPRKNEIFKTEDGTPIVQVGEYFFCSRSAGIFRSADKGKTWKLLLPSLKDKFFNLFGSGNVIYAISTNGGC